MKIIMWELTVPWEENERKKLKYDELVELCKNNGWKAKCTPIEVGSRGCVARSLCKALSDIGLTGSKKMKVINKIIERAERSATWLWLKRNSSWMTKEQPI